VPLIFRNSVSRLVSLLFRVSPAQVILSMFFKVAFLATQLGSIWLTFYWVAGSIPTALVSSSGISPESNVWAFIGAGGLFLSSLISLMSKALALKATFRFEKVILESGRIEEVSLLPGDLKNGVKVLLSLIDVTVPILLIVSLVVFWAIVNPYSILVIVALFFIGVFALKRGVNFSAGKYVRTGKRARITEYLESDEHNAFYKIMMLPSYISAVTFATISVSIIASVLLAKEILASGSLYVDFILIATAITFLQMRSFVGVIQRLGAYKPSLSKLNKIAGYAAKAEEA